MTRPGVTAPRSPGPPLVFASIGLVFVAVAPVKAANSQEWTTEPEYEIGGEPAAGATLRHVGQVRVSRDGSRVYVIERHGYVSAVGRGPRVTVWSPDGSLLVEVGPEDEIRNLGVSLGIRPAPTGFSTRHASLFAHFSHDGLLLETVEHPQPDVDGVSALAVLDDGTFIGLTRVPRPGVRLGWARAEPDTDDHLLHVLLTEDGWKWDTIADLDRRNLVMGVRAIGESSPIPTDHFAGQPFSDTDLFYLDPDSGLVGIVTRNGAPGEVDLNEITIRGDTTWQRHLELPSVPIPAEVLHEAVEGVVESVLSDPAAPGDALARLPLDTLRRMVRDALHRPSHQPPVTRAIATVSGEVWLRSAEHSDTMVAWYSLPRGNVTDPPRRILLPVWFRLSDVTDTHVWGIRTYEDGAAQVLGRKLISTAR